MATKQVNMHEAKTRLSELGELVWKGDKVIIAKAGKPYLDLLPHRPNKRTRKPGMLKGKIRMAADFTTTPPEVIGAFEDGA